MKNLPTFVAGLILAVMLVFYAVTFQVRFTEMAILKTFGKYSSTDIITEPGLKWKWPWPIQSVVKFDRRVRLMEDTSEETITQDSKNLIATVYAGWTISDPFRFHGSFRNEKQAEQRLREIVRAEKKKVVGQHPFSEFVSINPEEMKLDAIEQEILARCQSKVRDEYGIELKAFGIKKLALPKAVTQSVFDNMKQNETNKAERYRTEGEAIAKAIEARATESAERIRAYAKRRARAIESEAQRLVGSYYERFKGHEDLRIFLDEIETFKASFATKTTLILDPQTMPVDLFKLDLNKRGAPAPPADVSALDEERAKGQEEK